MQNPSPFGTYAPIIASVAALAILFGYGIALFAGNASAASSLEALATFAAGAIFGGAAAVPAINGHVASQASGANTRLDAIEAPTAERAAAIVAAKDAPQNPNPGS